MQISNKHHIPNSFGSITVFTFGHKKNPPIIFIHGFPLPFSQFSGNLPTKYLSENFFIIAFDLPGFGESKTLDISTNQLLKIITESLIPKRSFSLFGVSYGGLVALKTLSSGLPVNSLILAGMPYFPRLGLLQFILKLFKFSSKIKIFSQFSYLSNKNLNSINIPVLLLYSRTDKLATPEMAQKLSQKIKGSKLVFTSNLPHSHLLHRIDQSGFLKAISQFLNSSK